MSSQISGQKVWESLKQTPSYQGMPDFAQEAERPFVEKLPEILAYQLDDQVNYNNLMRARRTYFNYLIAHGFYQSVLSVLLHPSIDKELAKILIDLCQQTLKDVVGLLEVEMCHNNQVFLRSPEAELIYMVTQTGFIPDVLHMYLEDNLTIGQLLELQPLAIIVVSPLGKYLP